MYNRQFLVYTDFKCIDYNAFSSSHIISTECPHLFKINFNNILLNHLYKNDQTLWWKIIHDSL